MRKYWLLLAGLLVLTVSCQKIKTIPEVTSHLKVSQVLEFKEPAEILGSFSLQEKYHMVTAGGQIKLYRPGRNEAEIIKEIGPVSSFRRIGNYGFSQVKGKNHWLLLDLKTLKKLQVIKGLKIDKVCAFNARFLVYTYNKHLHIRDIKKSKILRRIPLRKRKALKVEFSGQKILILTSAIFYWYLPEDNRLLFTKLKERASSPFLLDGAYLYYGTNNRKLVKVSVKNFKLIWQQKIPRRLILAPIRFRRFVVIAPRDNNIYFYLPGGTLYWWKELQSALLHPPIKMKDNLAVISYPEKSPVINYLNIEEKSSLTREIKMYINFPLRIGEGIYFLGRQNFEDSARSLQQVGNQYAIAVQMDPEYLKPVNRSITFKLEPVNLLEPEFKIKILDSAKKNIFQKVIEPFQEPVFVWIPRFAGEYQLDIEASALNRPKVHLGKIFNIIDLPGNLMEFYFNLQNKIMIDKINSGIKASSTTKKK
jgi:hypothetical protein